MVLTVVRIWQILHVAKINKLLWKTPTFAFPCFSCHFTENDAVGYDDNDQRQAVDCDNIEEVIRQLVGRCREEVKGDTLGEPGEPGVVLHVEYDTLKDK